MIISRIERILFQHTAARRRLDRNNATNERIKNVSTHSRPKAAGYVEHGIWGWVLVSTHSRPKAAGQTLLDGVSAAVVSTHSRPKAAGHRPARTFGA